MNVAHKPPALDTAMGCNAVNMHVARAGDAVVTRAISGAKCNSKLFHGNLQVVEVSIVSDSFTLFKVSVTNCYIFLPAKALHARKRHVDQW